MHSLLVQLTTLEIAVFVLAATAFIFAIRFFIDSRKKLAGLFAGDSTALSFKTLPDHSERSAHQPNFTAAGSTDLDLMKKRIREQQTQLSRAMAQIDQIETSDSFRIKGDSRKQAAGLELLVQKKDAELKNLRQQLELSNKIQVHFDELQNEFEVLQEKLEKMEEQAWEANDLAMKVENLEQSELHLQKELVRKDEKINELIAEAQRLHSILNETEDKLRESNMMRQQLQKKAQFLEEMNLDMKQLSDTNRKLQTEIRKIGELESMLNLMMEERNQLLKRIHQ
jgi:chromosome segregation ATPase